MFICERFKLNKNVKKIVEIVVISVSHTAAPKFRLLLLVCPYLTDM